MESARNRCALRGRRNVHQTGNEQTRRGSPRCSDLHGLPGRTAPVGKQRGRAATEVRDAGRYYRCGSCVPPRSQGQGYDSPTAPSRRRPVRKLQGPRPPLSLVDRFFWATPHHVWFRRTDVQSNPKSIDPDGMSPARRGVTAYQWICPVTAIDIGYDPAAKGDPGMGASTPVPALIVYPETSLLKEFAT